MSDQRRTAYKQRICIDTEASLKARIKSAAEAAGLSMNKWCIRVLDEASSES